MGIDSRLNGVLKSFPLLFRLSKARSISMREYIRKVPKNVLPSLAECFSSENSAQEVSRKCGRLESCLCYSCLTPERRPPKNRRDDDTIFILPFNSSITCFQLTFNLHIERTCILTLHRRVCTCNTIRKGHAWIILPLAYQIWREAEAVPRSLCGQGLAMTVLHRKPW